MAVERVRARVDVEFAHEARALLRSIATLEKHRRADAARRRLQLPRHRAAAGRHLHLGQPPHHRGPPALRRADAAAEAEVEAALREAA
jgi:hypothetical protein